MEILVVAEHNSGVVHRMTWEAVAAGQSMARDLGLGVGVLIMGHNVSDMAREIATARLDEVLSVDHPLLSGYSAEGYASVLKRVIETESPAHVIMGHTYMVRDFLPKVSASLGKPLLGDIIDYKLEDGSVSFTKQIFQGKLLVDIVAQGESPHLITFQSAAFQSDAVEQGEGVSVREIFVDLDETVLKTYSEEPFQEALAEVDLSSAEVIVAVGRGIKEQENLQMVRKLAEVLGAQIAASRPVVDAEWLPAYHQVGSSGQTVTPKLYLALGISGAIQHVVGMKGSQNIIVINKDPNAPFFELADYGIVGDILQIVPRLTNAIQAEKRA